MMVRKVVTGGRSSVRDGPSYSMPLSSTARMHLVTITGTSVSSASACSINGRPNMDGAGEKENCVSC
jgi:hypothetical protein